MGSTTSFDPSSVVLVSFLFTDGRGVKKRPAVVISSAEYHSSRQEVIVAAVTGRIRKPPLVGDYSIAAWKACGLVKPSMITTILWTVKAQMIERKLGTLSTRDSSGYRRTLNMALGLPL